MNRLIFMERRKLFGFIVLLVFSILIRAPYFYYLSEPEFGGDIDQYYLLSNYVFDLKAQYVGYPNVGYCVFLKFCEFLNNTTSCVVFMQNLISVISIILFYFSAVNYLKKYYLYISFILIGFSTSNLCLAFESTFIPDSLLLSLLILCFAFILFYLETRNVFFLYFMFLSAIGAVSIRPTGIIFYSSIVFILFWFFYVKYVNLKQLIKLFFAFILFSTTIAFYNWISPMYKTFNIISFPPTAKYIDLYTDTTDELSRIISYLPQNIPPLSSVNTINKSNDYNEIFAEYRTNILYGINFYFIEDNLYAKTSSSPQICLDSIFSKSKHMKKFLFYKKKYAEKHLNKNKLYCLNNLKTRTSNFIYFFKYFYSKGVKTNSYDFDTYNCSFYTDNLNKRWWAHNCYHYLGNVYLDNSKNTDLVNQILKEKKYTHHSLLEYDNIYWSLKNSRIYRYFIKWIEIIQPIVFRSYLYIILFFIGFIISIFNLIKSKFHSSISFVTILSCFILLLINYLNSVYSNFLYLRYTVQVHFIYYLVVIMLPFLIEELFNLYKKNVKQ